MRVGEGDTSLLGISMVASGISQGLQPPAQPTPKLLPFDPRAQPFVHQPLRGITLFLLTNPPPPSLFSLP